MKFVEVDKIFPMFSRSKRRAKELYLQFVLEERKMEHGREFYEVVDQQLLGGEEFISFLLPYSFPPFRPIQRLIRFLN